MNDNSYGFGILITTLIIAIILFSLLIYYTYYPSETSSVASDSDDSFNFNRKIKSNKKNNKKNGEMKKISFLAGSMVSTDMSLNNTPVYYNINSTQMIKSNCDTGYIVNPGYKIDVYSGKWDLLLYSYDNTNGNYAKMFYVNNSNINKGNSIRLYYFGSEIIIPGISYTINDDCSLKSPIDLYGENKLNTIDGDICVETEINTNDNNSDLINNLLKSLNV